VMLLQPFQHEPHTGQLEPGNRPALMSEGSQS
jgi:hypothetical protein